MAQVYGLDVVIVQTPNGRDDAPSGKQLITIDKNTGKSVRKQSILGRIGKDLKYYLVSNNNNAINVAECELIDIVLPYFDYKIKLDIRYHASCNPGDETRLAEGLFDRIDPPAVVLNNKIKQWVNQLSRNDAESFINAYFENKNRLRADLSRRAFEETGVNLVIDMTLVGEKTLNPITIKLDAVNFRACDYDQEETFKVRAELTVDSQNKVKALLNASKEPELREMVPRELGNYIRERVTLQQLYLEFDGDEVKSPLKAHFNDILRPFGRKLEIIKVEGKSDASLKPYFPAQKDVKYWIQEYPELVTIKNTVQMVLFDLASYRRSGSEDLDNWLEKKLDRIIDEQLFEAKYIDLLLHFKVLEQTIKAALTKEAHAIGYEIKHLVTVPDLEPITWKTGMSITAEGEYETRVAGLYVKLKTEIEARIPNLETIRDYLNRNRQQNVKELMKEAAKRVTRQFIHKVLPERFYMRFNFTDTAEEPPVEQELKRLIGEVLEQDFGAEIIDITPKPVETELVERYKALKEQIGKFEVKLELLNDVESVVFSGMFQIESVDLNGWDKFQLKKYSLDEIRSFMEESIKANLATFGSNILAYRTVQERKQIEQYVKDIAQEYVREGFGLIAKIHTVHRHVTASEQDEVRLTLQEMKTANETHIRRLIAKGTTELEIDQEKLNTIKQLEHDRLSLFSVPGSEKQIEKIEDQIRRLKEEVDNQRPPSIDKVKLKYLTAFPSNGQNNLPMLGAATASPDDTDYPEKTDNNPFDMPESEEQVEKIDGQIRQIKKEVEDQRPPSKDQVKTKYRKVSSDGWNELSSQGVTEAPDGTDYSEEVNNEY
ncbi:MAG: hypothetical protein HY231_03440 [Acidobacteria bacterium]|nr:hypothetical protein [Acidobacteriota bacterium]